MLGAKLFWKITYATSDWHTSQIPFPRNNLQSFFLLQIPERFFLENPLAFALIWHHMYRLMNRTNQFWSEMKNWLQYKVQRKPEEEPPRWHRQTAPPTGLSIFYIYRMQTHSRNGQIVISLIISCPKTAVLLVNWPTICSLYCPLGICLYHLDVITYIFHNPDLREILCSLAFAL